jgi:hypothetical protein
MIQARGLSTGPCDGMAAQIVICITNGAARQTDIEARLDAPAPRVVAFAHALRAAATARMRRARAGAARAKLTCP